jgi:macrodomain Ter protein organizer (MatP/YcbG family)
LTNSIKAGPELLHVLENQDSPYAWSYLVKLLRDTTALNTITDNITKWNLLKNVLQK